MSDVISLYNASCSGETVVVRLMKRPNPGYSEYSPEKLKIAAMKFRIKPILFFILGILLPATFYLCSTDGPETGPDDFARLSDVTLKQTVNGGESLELSDQEPGAEIVFVSQLAFKDKAIGWSTPTLEQSFDKLFDITAGNVAVTNTKGAKIGNAQISVDGSKVKIVFAKEEGGFGYMRSATFKITVKTRLKEGITEEELNSFALTGYRGQSIFYGESSASNIKSNTVLVNLVVTPPEAEYNVKGDPDNDSYRYKLNVVYFVASDVTPNPDYKKRLSTILLKHQLFVCKWMKYWGYEEKSFGLPLKENGMVDIVTIYAKGPFADYPYEGGGSKMQKEIDSRYTEYNIPRHSSHTLVITATNEATGAPFYGLGKWAFALDYPGMSFESMAIDPITGVKMNPQSDATYKAMKWIGGMLHELGHGLNQPHVGPSYSAKYDPLFGMTLMGSGNYSYGTTPTYLHPTSAAILNNCQVSSKKAAQFYNTSTASVKINSAIVDGDHCIIQGKFEASENVTEVFIRFYNAGEIFLGPSHGYSSVAYVTQPAADNTFEAIIPVNDLRVNSFDYNLGATLMMSNGTMHSEGSRYTFRLTNNVLKNMSIINDGSWVVTTSHKLNQGDTSISNAPESLVDGDLSTILSMVKPGKSYGGVEVPEGEEVFVTIDFGQTLEFNAVRLVNRNSQQYLNAKAVSFYGSDDGASFTEITTNAKLPTAAENIIKFGKTVQYRYLKMTMDEWDTSQGSTMQFSELVPQKQ